MLRSIVVRRCGRNRTGMPHGVDVVTCRRFLNCTRWPTVISSSTSMDEMRSSPVSQRNFTTASSRATTTVHQALHLQQHQRQMVQVRHKVFVSKYNTMNVSAAQILEHCSKNGISVHETRCNHSHVILKECPFCEKPTMGKPDNEYKLYISIGPGAYFCHRCGAKGSWYDFKIKMGGFDVVGIGGSSSVEYTRSNRPAAAKWRTGSSKGETGTFSSHRNHADTQCLPMPPKRLAACYISSLMDQPDSNEVLDYLINVRGLKKTTLRKYGVGRATYNFPSKEASSANRYVAAECVTFPWIMKASDVAEQEELRGAKYDWNNNEEERTSASDESLTKDAALDPHVTRRIKARAVSEKSWQRLDPPGGGWGLFGFHTVPADANEVVITEGEYDAMAVYQGTGRPAVSLPNGCRSLPVEVLPLLERFDKIYLWMDNDGPGQEGAQNFAKKIGQNRCVIVKPTNLGEGAPKDANDALRMGIDMNQMLDDAKIVPHEFILTFEELRSQVLHEIIHPDKYVGVPVPSLPLFTSIVKGFRRGEITVITGPTGSGKTTFLGQLSLDFAEQGINTLWGSFEIKNTRLMHKLLQQFSREPLPVGKPEMMPALDALADRFQTLPLYFMKFHGGSDVDDVLDAMDFAAYVHDVEHVILDNMQFMISRNAHSGSSFDKFEVQDIAIEKFRKFATERNIHITLVVHPRKEDEGVKLGISSIYGSAKATQEADTVLILQNDGKRKYIEVKKNRFDGTLGFAPLFFQRASARYFEQPEVGGEGQGQLKPTIVPMQAGSVQAKFISSRTIPLKAASPFSDSAAANHEDDNVDNHWEDIFNKK